LRTRTGGWETRPRVKGVPLPQTEGSELSVAPAPCPQGSHRGRRRFRRAHCHPPRAAGLSAPTWPAPEARVPLPHRLHLPELELRPLQLVVDPR
jgi:hypothetical protein